MTVVLFVDHDIQSFHAECLTCGWDSDLEKEGNDEATVRSLGRDHKCDIEPDTDVDRCPQCGSELTFPWATVCGVCSEKNARGGR